MNQSIILPNADIGGVTSNLHTCGMHHLMCQDVMKVARKSKSIRLESACFTRPIESLMQTTKIFNFTAYDIPFTTIVSGLARSKHARVGNSPFHRAKSSRSRIAADQERQFLEERAQILQLTPCEACTHRWPTQGMGIHARPLNPGLMKKLRHNATGFTPAKGI